MSEPAGEPRVAVVGTFRARRGVTLHVAAAMAAMVKASREEDGCEAYSYAIDAFEPTIVRVFEIWRDAAALKRHRETNHLKAWRAKWNDLGLGDAVLTSHDLGAERPL